MRLLFIRHGDPDYAVDGLTPTGQLEAQLLSDRIAPMDIAEYYVSTMGRARDTARPTLEKAGRTADWHEHPVFAEVNLKGAYDRVVAEFERVLAAHGYVRDGLCYRVERQSSETLAFFCHFGVSCVLMSRLMNVSPMVLWHALAMAPSSVTTVYTEERRPGVASFRASAVGDISHLYCRGQEPSFAARFCEVYGNGDRVD